MKKFLISCLYISAGFLESLEEAREADDPVGHVRQWEKGLSIQEIVSARFEVASNYGEIQAVIATFTGLTRTNLSSLFRLADRINFVPCPTLCVALELYSWDLAQLHKRGETEIRYTEALEVIKSELSPGNIGVILDKIKNFERNPALNHQQLMQSLFETGVKRDAEIFYVLQNCIAQLEPSLQTEVRRTLLPYLMNPERFWLINIRGGGTFWDKTQQFIFSGDFKEGDFESCAQDLRQMSLEKKIHSFKADIAISDQVIHESSGIVRDLWTKVQQTESLGDLIELYVALKYFKPEDTTNLKSMISENIKDYIAEVDKFEKALPSESCIARFSELASLIEQLSKTNPELDKELHSLLTKLTMFRRLAFMYISRCGA